MILVVSVCIHLSLPAVCHKPAPAGVCRLPLAARSLQFGLRNAYDVSSVTGVNELSSMGGGRSSPEISSPDRSQYICHDARIGVKPLSVVCIRGNIGPQTEFHDRNLPRAQPEPNGYKHCR